MIGITFQITEINSNKLHLQNFFIFVDPNNRIFGYNLLVILENITHTFTWTSLPIKLILSTDQIFIIIIYITFTNCNLCFFHWFFIISITIIIISFVICMLISYHITLIFCFNINVWNDLLLSIIYLVIRFTVWNFTFSTLIGRFFRTIWINFWIFYSLCFCCWIFIGIIIICLVFSTLIYFYITFYFIFRINMNSYLRFYKINFVLWFSFIFCSIYFLDYCDGDIYIESDSFTSDSFWHVSILSFILYRQVARIPFLLYIYPHITPLYLGVWFHFLFVVNNTCVFFIKSWLFFWRHVHWIWKCTLFIIWACLFSLNNGIQTVTYLILLLSLFLFFSHSYIILGDVISGYISLTLFMVSIMAPVSFSLL